MRSYGYGYGYDKRHQRNLNGGGEDPIFEFVNSSFGVDTSIELPAGLQADDLSIVWNFARGTTTAPASVTPAGHSILREDFLDAATSGRAIISAKKLDGTETTLTGMNSAVELWIAAVFRPSTPFVSFAAHSTSGEIAAGDPAAQTIEAAGAAGPAILFGQMATQGAVGTRTVSPAMSEIEGFNAVQYAHYKIYNSSPATHSYDTNDGGSINCLQSGYLTFTF